MNTIGMLKTANDTIGRLLEANDIVEELYYHIKFIGRIGNPVLEERITQYMEARNDDKKR